MQARRVERLPEVMLGHGGRSGRALHQQKLALDAQQLGEAPVPLVALAAGQRLVDSRQRRVQFPGGAQALGQHAQKHRPVRQEPRLGKRLYRVPQHRQSGSQVAASDEQLSFEATRPGVPAGKLMLRGMIEQLRHEAFGACQIA